MIFVLVCESGEYSDVEYEVMNYYDSYEDAHTGQQYYEEETRLTQELVAIHGGYTVPRRYSIIHVMKGMHDIDQLRKQFAKRIEDAKQIQVDKMIQRTVQQEENRMQLERKMQNDVHAFLDWWESNDPFFEAKQPAKLRDICSTFYAYTALQMGVKDERAMTWYTKHKELLIGKGYFIRKYI